MGAIEAFVPQQVSLNRVIPPQNPGTHRPLFPVLSHQSLHDPSSLARSAYQRSGSDSCGVLQTLRTAVGWSLCHGQYTCFYTVVKMLRLYEQSLLEAVSSASWPWFGPISNKGASLWSVIPRTLLIDVSLVARDFGFTLNEVNWLGNITACVYLPMALLIPVLSKRYGTKRCVCTLSCLGGESYPSHLYSVRLLLSYSCYLDGSVMLELRDHCLKVVPTPSSSSARWESNLGTIFSHFRLKPPLGAFRHFSSSIPDFGTKIFGTVV